jgi:hypothetical protein
MPRTTRQSPKTAKLSKPTTKLKTPKGKGKRAARKTSSPEPEEPTHPRLIWSENLVWSLLNILEENPTLRRATWAGKGQKAVGEKKIEVAERIAEKLLCDDPVYGAFVAEHKRAYGLAVKAKLRR